MKFLSPEVALYLYKSVICPCMEYCCHIWAGAPRCYLELLDKLQKQTCWSVGPSLAAPLEPLARCLNVAGLSLLQVLFWWMFFRTGPAGSTSFFLREVYSLNSDRLHDFSVTIPRCYKDVYVNSFFPCTARLWNSLPLECSPLTYNLNGFEPRVNRHLLTVKRFLLKRFPLCFIQLCFFFL